MVRKIIWVASEESHECVFMSVLSNKFKNQLEWDFFGSVEEAVLAVDSQKYQGVYIRNSSLLVSPKLIGSRFDESKKCPSVGGVYLARYSIERGLPTLVTTWDYNFAEMEETGAIIVNCSEGSSWIEEFDAQFKKLFLGSS